ncbi:MAG: DUF402 domain-containing protein [Candidatus Dormibacteraceae bacterium]
MTAQDQPPALKRWRSGDVIVRREIVNGRPWLGHPQIVVRDSDQLLAVYTPEGARFAFPPGRWPTPTGLHPWHGKGGWEGNGVLHLMRPGGLHAVWVFWDGADRLFDGWYINIQDPFRRTSIGYDTRDLELDIIVERDLTWSYKDRELIHEHVGSGRFTPELGAAVLAEGERVGDDLDAGRLWWDPAWASWRPDRRWQLPSLPPGWDEVEVPAGI